MDKNTQDKNITERQVLIEGKFLRFVCENGWEHVERTNCIWAVVIVARTRDGKVLFVEQERKPVKCNVIEFPAGLVGDEDGNEEEEMLDAARRELREETGYEAGRWEEMTRGPVSPGLSTEMIVLLVATDLEKVGEPSGDGTENIIVHEVPMENMDNWLREMKAQGKSIDPKIFIGLYFLSQLD